ncbi:MAG: RagB/SusD family nutrient uptake outer membrane protein [Cytophagales bacterium]|nr:MAG: RagB/SusD family nutrient uptake outer membrane protein [Cytophagales bacterium]
MKKSYLKIMSGVLVGACLLTYSCKDSFLDVQPIGALSQSVLADKKGAEALLIGAYSLLDGQGAGGNWNTSGTNWVYGSVVGGDANKGSDAGDQPDINPMVRYEATPTNSYFDAKWVTIYEGVSRSNGVLRTIAQAKDASAADKTRISAEARFLRAHYHFEAKKMWNNIPFVDENNVDYKLPNDKDAWANIEADLKFAYDNLPGSGLDAGRANKWAAGAMYAKCLLFQKKFTEAKNVLDAVIANGTTPGGVKYALNAKFSEAFTASNRNSAEAVFSIQYSINDGSGAANAAAGDVLNFPYKGGASPGGCCGFFQPTQELVNSFRVDANGLPLVNGSYNTPALAVKSDQNLTPANPFTPDAGTLDPRLDWTVGRRGIPYRDWGIYTGSDWVRDQSHGGPYSPIKNTYDKAQEGKYTDGTSWTSGYTANNYSIIRFADVLLWAAEAEVEVGSLERARTLVNQVRTRAANRDGFVKTASGAPAANYVINNYNSPWTDKEAARAAVRFERKLELAMEGHRFFDLVRWGIAATALNDYMKVEGAAGRTFLNGATFRAGKSEYFPIPQRQIDLQSAGGTSTLKQNPGY